MIRRLQMYGSTLETAGFRVVSALNFTAVQEAFHCHRFDLVLIGYSLPAAEKRRVWQYALRASGAPLLELSQDGTSERLERSVLFIDTPQDCEFLNTVHNVISGKDHGATGPTFIDLDDDIDDGPRQLD